RDDRVRVDEFEVVPAPVRRRTRREAREVDRDVHAVAERRRGTRRLHREGRAPWRGREPRQRRALRGREGDDDGHDGDGDERKVSAHGARTPFGPPGSIVSFFLMIRRPPGYNRITAPGCIALRVAAAS